MYLKTQINKNTCNMKLKCKGVAYVEATEAAASVKKYVKKIYKDN